MNTVGIRFTQIARILHNKVAWGLSTIDSKGDIVKDFPVDKKTQRILVPQDFFSNTNNSGDSDSGSSSISKPTTPTKPPVTVLPNGTILFEGAATDGEIKLAGVNDSWSNIADGILVYFSDKIPVGNNYAKLSDCVKFNNPLLINKEQLKKGNSIGLASKHPSADVMLYTPAGKTWNSASLRAYQISPSDAIPSGFEGAITINSSSINLISGTFDVDGHGAPDSSAAYTGYSIVKVTAYTK
ncbi:hypothetical protein DS831_06095 [Bombilactobacillus bombi]|uniref:Uncharacterized protein n=1 Tax=Bombilactobacillus bombi TaxID=1303590 RepID=A0A417ZEP7_9LACO|nr:hypothetical protein [Bombilactobacillus bombi]RHW49731.1 hypothetical protein DS831_06095 [Bombilactobacillus bombi]